MNSLWPRVLPLLAKVHVLGRLIRSTGGAAASAHERRPGAVGPGGSVPAPAPDPVPANLASALLLSRPRPGGAWHAPLPAGQRTPISILRMRAGAPPGEDRAADDGRAARTEACALRRDAPHVRSDAGISPRRAPGPAICTRGRRARFCR